MDMKKRGGVAGNFAAQDRAERSLRSALGGRHRRIGGKNFQLLPLAGSGAAFHGPLDSKTVLRRRAAALRGKGYNVRVIKVAEGHTLWLQADPPQQMLEGAGLRPQFAIAPTRKPPYSRKKPKKKRGGPARRREGLITRGEKKKRRWPQNQPLKVERRCEVCGEINPEQDPSYANWCSHNCAKKSNRKLTDAEEAENRSWELAMSSGVSFFDDTGYEWEHRRKPRRVTKDVWWNQLEVMWPSWWIGRSARTGKVFAQSKMGQMADEYATAPTDEAVAAYLDAQPPGWETFMVAEAQTHVNEGTVLRQFARLNGRHAGQDARTKVVTKDVLLNDPDTWITAAQFKATKRMADGWMGGE